MSCQNIPGCRWRLVEGGVRQGLGHGVATWQRLAIFLSVSVSQVMSCQNIPGLSLGMVRSGVRQGLGYGVADMETARPVDEDTLFGIGSNTKAFAAATMANLMVSLPADKR